MEKRAQAADKLREKEGGAVAAAKTDIQADDSM